MSVANGARALNAAERFFSQSYAQARERFLGAARDAGAAVASVAHPLSGFDGEALATDAVRIGHDDAPAVLLVSSACHGVEGFCGSAVQTMLLGDAPIAAAAREAGIALLLVHALNPWGFSHWRRVTQENVDLNRNFHDFSRPLPANPGYAELADAIVPATWPPGAESERRLQAYAERHGMAALQAAVTGGQYTHPQGLFYGGNAPTWSQHTLRRLLREQAGRCARLGWIDLHTGLGPSGHGEKIFAGRHDTAALARARAWWGEEVTSVDDGSSSSAPLEGLMWQAAIQECPQAEVTGIALEYGTLPLPDMLIALRRDHWAANQPTLAPAERLAVRRATRDAFYVDTPQWKDDIIRQARQAVLQALAGLSGGRTSAS